MKKSANILADNSSPGQEQQLVIKRALMPVIPYNEPGIVLMTLPSSNSFDHVKKAQVLSPLWKKET